MDTMHIELTNQKAAGILNELAELNLIKIFRREIGEPSLWEDKPSLWEDKPVKTKLSEKYRGFLTREDGQQLNNHVNQMRNEWNGI